MGILLKVWNVFWLCLLNVGEYLFDWHDSTDDTLQGLLPLLQLLLLLPLLLYEYWLFWHIVAETIPFVPSLVSCGEWKYGEVRIVASTGTFGSKLSISWSIPDEVGKGMWIREQVGKNGRCWMIDWWKLSSSSPSSQGWGSSWSLSVTLGMHIAIGMPPKMNRYVLDGESIWSTRLFPDFETIGA